MDNQQQLAEEAAKARTEAEAKGSLSATKEVGVGVRWGRRAAVGLTNLSV
jgi:hypothetical protein